MAVLEQCRRRFAAAFATCILIVTDWSQHGLARLRSLSAQPLPALRLHYHGWFIFLACPPPLLFLLTLTSSGYSDCVRGYGLVSLCVGQGVGSASVILH
ncbi:hypothetical protein BDV34DRAFT_184017 [Aspergillus parasiticus]|uniref:Uncharacterized protein n=1 Tax=Aspergillus parasiticus TaxID=5067 RepID=A0A5N6E6H2_ASPPA|nr:hypothetical protein BDV34DRAFT_184017 [Aspergillus parasiticus]